MKKPITLFTLVLLITCFISCTSVSGKDTNYSTKIISRSINIDQKFTGLQSQAGIEIIYTQDNLSSKALIKGPEYLVNGMTWTINSKGVLSFKYPKKFNNIRGKVTIQLNGGLIDNLVTSSSGSITVTTSIITSSNLNFSTSSSGSITLMKDVEGKGRVNIDCSSGGQISFSNLLKFNTADINLSSSAYLKIPVLNVKSLNYSGNSVGILNIDTLNFTDGKLAVSSGASANILQCNGNSLVLNSSSGAELILKNIVSRDMDMNVSSGGSIKAAGKCEKAIINASSGGSINAKGLEIQKIVSQSVSSGGNIKI